MTDLGLDLAQIAEAATVIDPVFLNSPQYFDEQLCAGLGRRVLTKVETLNPLRSFKGRGADFLVQQLKPGATVVCASSGGNFGQAVAYAARRHGMRAEVFAPADTDPGKLRRMTAFGAVVHEVDGDVTVQAQEYASLSPVRVFVADGRESAVAEGNGTIAAELLRTAGIDTVLLPVGDGALISGVARWLKAHQPDIRVVGVGAAAAPAMVRSWRSGQVRTAERRNSFAAGISIRQPFPEAVRRVCALVDDMVLVEDVELVDAMHLVAQTLGLLVEPSGAAGLAAIAGHDIPGDVLATVITGANTDLEIFADRWSGKQ